MSKKTTSPSVIKIVVPPTGIIPLSGQIPASRNTPPPVKPKKINML